MLNKFFTIVLFNLFIYVQSHGLFAMVNIYSALPPVNLTQRNDDLPIRLLIYENNLIKINKDNAKNLDSKESLKDQYENIKPTQNAYRDFDECMQDCETYDKDYAKKCSCWQLLKKIYTNNFYNEVNKRNKELDSSSFKEEKYLIPKKIHQIWLGSKFPDVFKKWQKTWLEKNPGWEYKLWTDADIKIFKFKNKKFFDAETNWGAKSDILRYAILEEFGGVYADTDCQCIKSLDLLHKTCTFYAGIAYLKEPFLYNGFIGATPHHPIIKSCVDNISNLGEKENTDHIQTRTGPFYFTRCFFQIASTCKDPIVVFPPCFFYPMPIRSREYIDNPEKIDEFIKKYITFETFINHYWTCTWVEKDSYLNKTQKHD